MNELEQAIFNDRDRAFTLLSRIPAEQEPTDVRISRLSAWAFWENQHYHFEKALGYLDQAIAQTDRQTAPARLGELYLDRSSVLLNLNRWTEVQKNLDQARRLIKSANARLKAQLAAREGLLHLRLDNQVQAQELLVEAEKYLTGLGAGGELKDYYILTLVISGLGALYESRNEREKSIEAYQRVLPIVEEHKLWPRLSWHYLNTGRVLLTQNNFTEARYYFEKALETANDGDLEVKAGALSNLGIVAFRLNDFEQAAARFDEGEALFPQPSMPGDFDNLSKIEFWRSQIAWMKEDIESTENYLIKAYEIGAQGHDWMHQRRICINLSVMYAGRDVFDRAWEWQKRATTLTEEYYQRLRENERLELDARYQLERSRQETQMAQLRVTGLQSRALRAQMNPHFLFNALNAIQGFITSGRDGEAATQLARFAKFMRQTLDYSDLEQVSLDEEIDFIRKYLEINKKLRFRDKLNYLVEAPAGADTNDLLIPAMIIQPFVENAIEHGLRPKQEGNMRIWFQLAEDEKMLRCVIEDDGVGYNAGRRKQASHSAEHQTHRSRGMDITRERLSLLHGNPAESYVHIIDMADLTNGDQNGTRVEVFLPLLEEI